MSSFADLTYGQQSRLGCALGEIADALVNGKRIQAIKTVREITGLGLREAKDIVDKLCPPPAWGQLSHEDFIVTGVRYDINEIWDGFGSLDNARNFATDLSEDVKHVKIARVVCRAELKRVMVNV